MKCKNNQQAEREWWYIIYNKWINNKQVRTDIINQYNTNKDIQQASFIEILKIIFSTRLWNNI